MKIIWINLRAWVSPSNSEVDTPSRYHSIIRAATVLLKTRIRHEVLCFTTHKGEQENDDINAFLHLHEYTKKSRGKPRL